MQRELTTLPTRVIRAETREQRRSRLTAGERATGYRLRPNRTNARRAAIEASLAGF